MDINHRIARRLRELRDTRGYSLDTLAERSGVSRSNISLIERGQSSPTAAVLDKLAVGLSVALASFFEDGTEGEALPSPLIRAADQPRWQDPASGYVRRRLSPPAPSPLQLVEVEFPPGQRVALDSAVHDADIHQQVWLVEGRMDLTVGTTTWALGAGDCLAMQLNQPIVFHNPGTRPARYLVALTTLGLPPARFASPTPRRKP
ncbi:MULTISPECIES: helix-turn-helix domain-containing protein [unclassified Acidovorax]|uniref:helix-turn-helix domain-containing protein n=1 Tax=unclassified Acidovorax TaxID=2684926 RepID=UPI001C45CBBE|nr:MULTISPECIES: helix-turn-helix domain-containing protein [unclassified Acidovorax]MBV7430010.1 helix-turn-helix domain-containing protein [Acidovorax sp. sif0732]MBV7451403.1 helix-turn-helix domain-containing protein [Acidovorax sp. sif0715]